MRSFFATLRSLTLPMGAGAGSSRMVLGPDIPPLLSGFYNTFGVVYACELAYADATTYMYRVWMRDNLSGLTATGQGWVSGSTVKEESLAYVPGASFNAAFGLLIGNALNAAPVYGFTTSFRGVFGAKLNPSDTGYSAVTVENTVDFLIGSRSQGRGMLDRVSSVASTGAIGAEAVVLTGNNVVWRSNRAYECIFNPHTSGSIASNNGFYTIRKTNLAGTILGAVETVNSPTIGNGNSCLARIVLVNATAADVTANIVLTLQAVGGGTINDSGGGVYNFVRYLEVRDCGVAGDYTNATQI